MSFNAARVNLTRLDGRTFATFVAAGAVFLGKYRGVLNDLNVFPVPDGDTGTNLYLTARGAARAARDLRGAPLGAVAEAVARGSLMAARGNSGVILSQMLRGFARAVGDLVEADVPMLARALGEAAATARVALHKPVEGTMLSVADAAAGAAATAASEVSDLRDFIERIVTAAAVAVERTPEQLPVLREAGVVDAGGAGVLYFLEGALRFGVGRTGKTAFPRAAVRAQIFARTGPVGAERYCTEFVVNGVHEDVVAVRAALGALGDSLVVAGEPPLLKIHIHAVDPGAIRAAVAPFGQIVREKVEDMERQHRMLLVDAPVRPWSVVAVVPGLGFARILRDLGVEATVDATDANPSVRELLAALDASLGERTYLLPNDPNVLLAANEAAALARRPVEVIPTADIGAGLAVALALSSGASEPPPAEALRAAVVGSRTAVAFFAGRDSSVGGIAVAAGAAVAACEGRLIPAESLAAALAAAARALSPEGGDVLTLFYGAEQTDERARELLRAIAAEHPDVEVEVHAGGQRSSEYLIVRER
ncbi:MAG: DAK2 domain-containing protein [Candidatus Baltobacteraceae bacterium]